MYPLLHMTKYYGLCCVLATMYYCDVDPVTISMHIYYCVRYYAHVLLCPLLCTCIVMMHMYYVRYYAHIFYEDYYAHVFYARYYAHVFCDPAHVL